MKAVFQYTHTSSHSLPLFADSHDNHPYTKGGVLDKPSYPCVLVHVLISLLFCSVAMARTWHVPAEAPTIQAGIDSATAQDAVEIACGTYFEHALVMKSGIVLRSATNDPECVTIDAEGNARVIICVDVDDSAAIEGLTLTGGLAWGTYPDYLGGGLYFDNSSPAISNCIIYDNTGDYGGGMYCQNGSSPTISDCIFRGNSSESMGGGLFCFNGSSPVLSGCTLSDNHAAEDGGGLYCSTLSVVTLSSCTFFGNSAPLGGGIACFNNSSCTLEYCLLSFSSVGRAIHYDVGSTPALQCSDLYGNVDGDWTGSLTHQLGTLGNIHEDPLFCATDPDGEQNWTLQSISPCLPAQSACGQMGAWGEGCSGTATVVSTWGEMKVRYR